ncbi:MAG: PIN domain-containing protein [Methanobacteriota archaeon]
MLIVVDSNIIFASLIKDSFTRKILISSEIDFVVPEWVHAELREHFTEIAKKSGLRADEVEHFAEEIFQVVQTVPKDEYEDFLPEAVEIMKDIDRDDAPVLALAMALHADGVWTRDKDFERQVRVRVVRAEELIEML